NRAFQDELARVDGSLPYWLVLIALKSGRHASQRELADAVGIRGATLTRHLDSMQTDGLVSRSVDPDNRRIQRVELTEAGAAAFRRMRRVAMAFDQRLRTGLSSQQIEDLCALLDHVHANIDDGQDEPMPHPPPQWRDPVP
ncbi:MarR family winged helix-turn-helix transcriptional regulator, partial [Intrasporangium sp.]|uniref:MarR family winged helix-turn-helix transcriptional regulator n=1 Tax=Intrasporangium sp. TaxID=1925024 RepID=UPI00322218AB